MVVKGVVFRGARVWGMRRRTDFERVWVRRAQGIRAWRRLTLLTAGEEVEAPPRGRGGREEEEVEEEEEREEGRGAPVRLDVPDPFSHFLEVLEVLDARLEG